MSGVALEVAQQLQAVDVGQVHVEQDQVGPARADGRQAVEAGHRHLQLDLRRAAPGCRASPRRWSRCPRRSGRCAGGSRPARRRRRRGASGRCPGRSAARQAQDERRAFAGEAAARRSEPPISSARRRLMTRPMPVPSVAAALAAEPVERLEQLVHLRRRHAQAGVGDRDLDAVGAGLSRLRDVDAAAVAVVLDGVADSRLVRICLTRVASPTHAGGAGGRGPALIRMPRRRGVAGDQGDRRPRPAPAGRASPAAGAGCPTRCATGRARR